MTGNIAAIIFGFYLLCSCMAIAICSYRIRANVDRYLGGATNDEAFLCLIGGPFMLAYESGALVSDSKKK